MKDHAERADACEAREAVMLEDMSAMRDKLASHADTIAALREGLQGIIDEATHVDMVDQGDLDRAIVKAEALLEDLNPGEDVQQRLKGAQDFLDAVLVCRDMAGLIKLQKEIEAVRALKPETGESKK